MATLNYANLGGPPRPPFVAPGRGRPPPPRRTAFVNSPYTFGGPVEIPCEVPPTSAAETPRDASPVSDASEFSSSGILTPNLSFGSTSGALPIFLSAAPEPRPSAAVYVPELSSTRSSCPPQGQILSHQLRDSGACPPWGCLPPPTLCSPHPSLPPLQALHTASGAPRATPAMFPSEASTNLGAVPAAATAAAAHAPASPRPKPCRTPRLPFRAELVGRSRSAPSAPWQTPRPWGEGPDPLASDTTSHSLSEDQPSVFPVMPSCQHPKPWKKLRAKRGVKFYMCVQCGERWRLPCKYHLLSEPSPLISETIC
eukprot:EG_transcript_12384